LTQSSAIQPPLNVEGVELAPQNGMIWNTLGVAQYCAGNWKVAITALEKSMELRKGGDSFDWFILAMAQWQLGQKDEARKRYDQAVAWMDKNRPQNKELRRFRAEATELLGVKPPPAPRRRRRDKPAK
jgi:tetratricopeptide (TPR) repeat protein